MLFVLLVISILPLIQFFANDYPNASTYISQLLRGKAFVDIDVATDTFMIVSRIFLGIWSTKLSYMLVVIGSAVAFFVSLILIALVEESAITKRIVHLKSAFHL